MLKTCIARTTDRMNMKALTIPPIRFDKSKPEDLNALPAKLWSKVFSTPTFSTILLTALPTNVPMIHPSMRIIIAAKIPGSALIISPTMLLKTSIRSTKRHHSYYDISIGHI